MEKLHRVSCQSGYPIYRWTGLDSTAPAGDMRYSLVVQAFTIASHHSVPPAPPHWQEDVEARRGSLAHLAQTVPSSITAAWGIPGQALSSPVLLMACVSPAQDRSAPSILEGDTVLTSFTLWSIGCSHSLLTSQWLSRKVRMSAVATSAPRTRERISPTARKGQQRSWKVRMGNSWASFRKNTWCGHYRERAGGSSTSHHQKQRVALAGHPPGDTVSWALPAHKEWSHLSLLAMPLSFHLVPAVKTSPPTSSPPCRYLAAACLVSRPLEHPAASLTTYTGSSSTLCFLPFLLLICFIPICSLFCPAVRDINLALRCLLTFLQTILLLGCSSWTKQWFLAPGLLCTDSFRNKPIHGSQTKEQPGKWALSFMHIGDIWEITFLNYISLW